MMNITKEHLDEHPFLRVVDKYKDDIDWTDIDTFFECGTGETGFNAVAFSDYINVVTVDNCEDFYNGFPKEKSTKNSIKWILGDGTEELKKYLIDNPDKRLLILLDDHMGYTSFIKEELQIIQENSNCKNHIIMIDDTIFYGKGTYPTHEWVENKVNEINSDYKIHNSGIGNDINIIIPIGGK